MVVFCYWYDSEGSGVLVIDWVWFQMVGYGLKSGEKGEGNVNGKDCEMGTEAEGLGGGRKKDEEKGIEAEGRWLENGLVKGKQRGRKWLMNSNGQGKMVKCEEGWRSEGKKVVSQIGMMEEVGEV
ncbi:hypothetical protein V6N13_040086 [Hibiscus sabdariffa]